MTFTTRLVDRASAVVATHVSRRSFINRSALVGSAVAVGAGLDLALKPGTAYGLICECGNSGCGCGSKCCEGFTEFCCTMTGGYNYCPSNSIIGGWWKADNSSYCGTGPRYYMDCNGKCSCGAGGYGGFCSPSCDGLNCGCGPDGCDSFLTGCLQFRYGQCNQDVPVIGRIFCRVVACVPPWEVDPTCTTTNAVDDGTAEQDEPCWTPAFPAGPPPPCDSPATNCQVVGLAVSPDGQGYAMITSFGRLFTYGDFEYIQDESTTTLAKPIVGVASTPTGKGYWFVAADGGIFAFGDAAFYGSMGGRHLNEPIVGMAVTPTGAGYWLVASDGGIFAFGDAPFYGSMGGQHLNRPIIGMTATKTGGGYWFVASDGGIFAFGNAPFLGSAGDIATIQPIVGIAVTATGQGYWLATKDAAIYAFGNAQFKGPEQTLELSQPIVAIGSTISGMGYWLAAADGGIFSFGDAPYYGSPA